MKENNSTFEVNEPPVDYNAQKDFTSLECWQKARFVKLFFFREVLPELPPEEKYQLNKQIRQAIVSITANIAEGYGRFSYKEGIQFYRISRASLYELKDHLISCLDFNYISSQIYNNGIELIENAKISLNGFIKYVKHKIK